MGLPFCLFSFFLSWSLSPYFMLPASQGILSRYQPPYFSALAGHSTPLLMMNTAEKNTVYDHAPTVPSPAGNNGFINFAG
jgi:hypothetical protein